MSSPYGVAALLLVSAALLAVALCSLGVRAWVRWIVALGPPAGLVALVLTGGAALNAVVPRSCDEAGIVGVQRPVTAALASVGACRTDGLAQLALVPLAGVASSLVAAATAAGAAPGGRGRRRAATDDEVEPAAGDRPPPVGRTPEVAHLVGADVVAPPAPARRLGHRPELDGVRGLAVLAVLVGHAGVLGLPKLHIYGVGLFFVLSGFLITALLLEERADTGTIRLRTFYLRRVLRLGPALVAFLVGVGVLTRLTGAFEADEVARGSRAAALYVANYARIDGQALGPVGHLWSLSVEEHFYLVWPALAALVLAAAGTRRLAWLSAYAGVGLATSVGLTIVFLHQREFLRVENATETRASGLLAGCLLALWFHARPARAVGRVAGAVLVALSLVALVALSTDRWFGPRGELPVELAATTLLAGLVLLPSAANRVLAWTPLALVGRLSYALYLWHVPIFLLVADEMLTMSVVETVLATALSLGVALTSFVLVERPVLARRPGRRGARPPTPQVPADAPAAATGVPIVPAVLDPRPLRA